MKKRAVKLLTILLAILMIITTMPLSVAAESTDDGLEYVILGEEVTITKYTGDNTEVVIPSEIEGYPVTTIGDNSFFATLITSIDIPNSVTSIGNYAFNYSNIKSITIPESVHSIGEQAIARCKKLEQINLSNGIETIGEMAFAYCPLLSDISIPESVTTLGAGAFGNCTGLTSITIPDTVINVGAYLFEGCSSLEEVKLPQGMKKIGYSMFNGCKELAEVDIPDTVKEIEYNAFRGCKNVSNIVIPDGVANISDDTFYGCTALTSITIPKTVKAIGEEAFYNCDDLFDVYYGGTQIQWNAIEVGSWNQELRYADVHFQPYEDYEGITADGYKYSVIDEKVEIVQYNGTETEVVIPSKIDGYPVTSIFDYAFWKENEMISVVVPEGVEQIGEYAFSYCTSLNSISLPSTLKIIRIGAFINTAYYENESNWTDGVLYIDSALIRAKDIDGHYDVKEGTTIIANTAINSSKLTSLTIPSTVLYIGEYAFAVTGITSVTIPESVVSIGNGAFLECKNLKEINVDRGNSCYASDLGVLYDKNYTTLVYHPESNVNSHCYISPDVVTIGQDAFNGSKNLYAVTIPDSVVNIEMNAFRDCSNLSNVYYSGTEEQWSQITVGNYNYDLLDVTMHFGSTGPGVVAPDNPPVTPPTPSAYDKGDVDLDGRVTIKDATEIQRHLAQLTTLDEIALSVADTDNDGRVAITDATRIQKFLAQLITEL